MPELPEVETTRRGLEPLLVARRITGAVVRNATLRWPVAPELTTRLPGSRIDAVARRAKYLVLATGQGHLLLHLGMSGSLRVLPAGTPATKHDHVDILLDDGQCLRLRDPRPARGGRWTSTPRRSVRTCTPRRAAGARRSSCS
jgi:formamidopyrimidine-DNA glycosylase